MAKKEDVKHLGLRMDPKLHQKLAYIAKYEGRSLNGQAFYLFQTCVREFEKEHGPIDLDGSGDGQA